MISICFAVLSLLHVAMAGMITFFEGNDGSQNQVCTIFWDQDLSLNFQHYDACSNDEARSAYLHSADFGTTITVYYSPSGDKGDDYTIIKVKAQLEVDVLIRSFEQSQTISVPGGTIEVDHHHHNG